MSLISAFNGLAEPPRKCDTSPPPSERQANNPDIDVMVSDFENTNSRIITSEFKFQPPRYCKHPLSKFEQCYDLIIHPTLFLKDHQSAPSLLRLLYFRPTCQSRHYHRFSIRWISNSHHFRVRKPSGESKADSCLLILLFMGYTQISRGWPKEGCLVSSRRLLTLEPGIFINGITYL